MRACFAPSVWVVIAAVLLAACATRGVWVEAAAAESAGDWQISQKVDSVTSARLTNVLLPSSKTAHSGLRYTPRALLQFACLKGQPVVHLQFAFQVGSKNDSDVAYRFDKKPSHSVKARFLRGLKIVLIENKSEVAQFLNGLATAKVLHLTISSLAKGRTSAEFRVTGAPAAIAAMRAGCR